MPEVTLVWQERDLTPDVCLYLKQLINLALTDVIKMVEPPLLAIEILSPRQAIQDILEKVTVYFEFGVKSCWVVIPPVKTVMVYSAVDIMLTFHEGGIHDAVLDLRIPSDAIFNCFTIRTGSFHELARRLCKSSVAGFTF